VKVSDIIVKGCDKIGMLWRFLILL